MSEPINLNKARKARDKAARKTRAAENRVVFGLPKGVKDLASARREKAARELDGQKRDD
jgi:hypothetical protein